MADGFVHTVYKNDEWVVEIEGNGDVGSHATKEDAVRAVLKLSTAGPNM